MSEPRQITPVVGPLLHLLRSRKFMIALMTLVVDVIVIYQPDLEPAQNELVTVFTVIGSMLIASIAYEDGQAKTDPSQ